VLVDAESLAPRATIKGGAADDWMFISWNGFRPRAASLDQPVTFESNDTVQRDTTENPFAGAAPSAGDTLDGDSAKAATPAAPAHQVPPGTPAVATHPAPADSAQKQSGFTVQFAALRDQSAAADALKDVHVSGATPKLVATTRDGVTIYRVVIGPFPTREDAERVARTSGKSYWVYEGAP
jgi:septal ring-binding cell division protein DamX